MVTYSNLSNFFSIRTPGDSYLAPFKSCVEGESLAYIGGAILMILHTRLAGFIIR